MQCCYLILAHSNVEQVLRIVNKLNVPGVEFVVHFDLKYNGDLSPLLSCPNLHMTERRYNVTWGTLSIVQAVMELCTTAECKCCADYYVLLSGADYPVKSGEYIKNFLTKTGENYIEGHLLPTCELPWVQGGYRRINAYNLILKEKQTATIEPRVYDIHNLKQFAKVLLYRPSKIKQFFRLFRRPQRELPFNGRLFGGEMWWMLRGETIRNILNYVAAHPKYIEFHQDTQIPDELFFNTLVYNLSTDVKNKTMRYIHWGNRRNLSPMYLTLKNKEIINGIIQNSNYLFVRKIEDKKLCDYIDGVVK